MKINDKGLAAYASVRCGVDKEGFLDKKGDVNHSYKRRWFVLKGNLLFYFERSGDRSPIGVIVLENCSVEVSDCERFAFCIRFQSKEARTYTLCADNDTEMERWMKSITSASFGYINMLVTEFEKNLERLKEIDLSDKGDTRSLEQNHSEMLLSKAKSLLDHNPNEETDSTPVAPPRKSKNPDGSLFKEKIPIVNTAVSTITRMKTKSLSVRSMNRSSSAENIRREKSPTVNRKSMKGATLNRVSAPAKEFVISKSILPDENDKATFELLHSMFGGAIWTKIGESL